jgi:uncharacterized protein (TIGR02453 family)
MMNEVTAYLSDLRKNNNREWFHANKEAYNKARTIFLDQVQQVIDKLSMKDPSLSGVLAKDTVFRIFRDVRFSNDKTPYKTHFSAYMAREGRKSRYAGYYFHVSDEEFFIAAGVHTPAKEDLRVIRQEILFKPDSFTRILSEKRSEGFEIMETDKLKKGPADFPKDSPHLELIKYKHYILSKPLDRSLLQSKDFASKVSEHFEPLVPWNNFLNSALEFTGNE